jgi:hypothetical protein
VSASGCSGTPPFAEDSEAAAPAAVRLEKTGASLGHWQCGVVVARVCLEVDTKSWFKETTRSRGEMDRVGLHRNVGALHGRMIPTTP